MKKTDPSIISGIVRRTVLDSIAANLVNGIPFDEPRRLFASPEINALKQEIVRVGRKLWERQYVDGNGGNISVRLSPHHVLCTPTLCSKGDMRVEDLSLVDLNNSQICGDRPQTSEILLHLEIYKAVPNAKAVIHCHPPYATAHAVAGVIPPGNLVTEHEVFVGPVALAPYETPGTQAFAETILPYVKNHNTILLANHGIVCWADTVTHAEWYVEVVETYCKTVMIASQLRPKLNEIPADKIQDLLALKKRLGLPDPRLPVEAEATETTELRGHSAAESRRKSAGPRLPGKDEVDAFVSRLTAEVIAFLNGSE